MGSWLCRSFRRVQRQTLLLFRHCLSMMDLCRNVRWVGVNELVHACPLGGFQPKVNSRWYRLMISSSEEIIQERKMSVCRLKLKWRNHSLLTVYFYELFKWPTCLLAIKLSWSAEWRGKRLSLPNAMHRPLPIVADMLRSALSTAKWARKDIFQ